MTAPTHTCPCGCGARIPHHRLACRTGWRRLPQHLRDRVNEAYLSRATNPVAPRLALQAALVWYRDNRPAGTR